MKQKYGLSIDSEYEKVAATSEDIIDLLSTLWQRADDIPMTPKSRITVHIYILILFISGCRPGMLKSFRWKDVELYLKFDADGRRRLVADLTLWFNKLQKGAVLTSSESKRCVLVPRAFSPPPPQKKMKG